MCIVVDKLRKEVQRVKKLCCILKSLHQANKNIFPLSILDNCHWGVVGRQDTQVHEDITWLWSLELHVNYSPIFCSYCYKLILIYRLFVLIHAELMLIFYRFDVYYLPHWWSLRLNQYKRVFMLKNFMPRWGLNNAFEYFKQQVNLPASGRKKYPF